MNRKKSAVAILCTLALTISCLTGCGNDSKQVNKGNVEDMEVNSFDISVTKEVINVINAQTISLGENYSAAITADGNLYMWGANNDGQLGNGTTESSDVPIKIMENVASVSLGTTHSAAITTDGSLYMWGNNMCGQLGNGTHSDSMKPTKIMDNVISVSLGESHSAAITADNELYVWGDNRYGQVGCGETDEDVTKPRKIMDDVESVSLKACSSAAVKNNHVLYMWGGRQLFSLFGSPYFESKCVSPFGNHEFGEVD